MHGYLNPFIIVRGWYVVLSQRVKQALYVGLLYLLLNVLSVKQMSVKTSAILWVALHISDSTRDLL